MIWEVFYSPHTDDETLGMAGAILRAKAVDHKVLVVLVTDNQPSTRGARIFEGQDPFKARRNEFCRAMRVLGVDELHFWELSEEVMFSCPSGVQDEIVRRIHDLGESRTIIHHHTVWGKDDIHVEVTAPTLAHVLCATALSVYALVHPMVRCSLHSVYIYSRAPEQRRAPVIYHLTSDQMLMKSAALDCFKPSAGTLGYGYASVPELFDAAAADPREFVQELP